MSELIELVASGVPPDVVDAAVDVLLMLADDADDADDALLHAIGRVPRRHLPDVIRLAGAGGTAELLEEIHPLLDASRPELRLAAIEACGGIGDSSSVPLLRALRSHEDETTSAAARRALQRLARAGGS